MVHFSLVSQNDPVCNDCVPVEVALAEADARLHPHQLHGLHWVLERGVRAECTEGAEVVRSL